jgi:hypothetical protein
MYAMTTENALKLMMDESFEGWGGEDVETPTLKFTPVLGFFMALQAVPISPTTLLDRMYSL